MDMPLLRPSISNAGAACEDKMIRIKPKQSLHIVTFLEKLLHRRFITIQPLTSVSGCISNGIVRPAAQRNYFLSYPMAS
jgi:hypothetical protein